MSNGLPPSPPPSSETEIQDQARAQAQAAAPAPEPAPRPPSPVSWSEDPLDFRGTILPTLVNFSAQEDFVSLVQLAERADLAVSRRYCADDATVAALTSTLKV
jgi:hypothetical protein